MIIANPFFDFCYCLFDYKQFSYLQSLYFADIKKDFSYDQKYQKIKFNNLQTITSSK